MNRIYAIVMTLLLLTSLSVLSDNPEASSGGCVIRGSLSNSGQTHEHFQVDQEIDVEITIQKDDESKDFTTESFFTNDGEPRYSKEVPFSPDGYESGDEIVVSTHYNGYDGIIIRSPGPSTCPVNMAAIQWVNEPPMIVGDVLPLSPGDDDELTADFTAFDPNGHSIGSETWSWAYDRDGSGYVTDVGLNNEETVPSSATQLEDRWRLQVTAKDEHDAHTTKNFFVRIGEADDFPSPALNFVQNDPLPLGVPVEFDASESTNGARFGDEQEGLKFRWDFEGNRNFTSFSEDATVSHTFEETGTVTVQLDVINAQDYWSRLTIDLEVREPPDVVVAILPQFVHADMEPGDVWATVDSETATTWDVVWYKATADCQEMQEQIDETSGTDDPAPVFPGPIPPRGYCIIVNVTPHDDLQSGPSAEATAIVAPGAPTNIQSNELDEAPVWNTVDHGTITWNAPNNENTLNEITGYRWAIDSVPDSESDFVDEPSVMLPNLLDGPHEFFVRAETDDGTLGKHAAYEFRIDATDPVVENLHLEGGSQNGNGWFTDISDLNLVFEVSDVTSGVASVEYRLDQGDWRDAGATNGEGTIDLNNLEEGTTTVDLRVTDEANNVITDPATINFDGTLPTIEDFTVGGGVEGENDWFTDVSDLLLEFKVTDVTSGVASVEYRLDQGDWQDAGATNGEGTIDLNNLEEGTTTVDLHVTDEANNAITTSRTFTVDTTEPSTDDDLQQNWPTNTIGLTAADPTSGVAAIHHRLYQKGDNPPVTFETTIPDDDGLESFGVTIELSEARSWILDYYAEDIAGNSEDPHTIEIPLDEGVKLTLSSPVESIVAGGSEQLTIHRRNALDEPVSGDAPLTVDLTTTSNQGGFLDSDGSSIAQIVIPEGEASVVTRYTDTSAATHTITVHADDFVSASKQTVVEPAKIAGLTFTQHEAVTPAGLESDFEVTRLDQFGNAVQDLDALEVELNTTSESGVFTAKNETGEFETVDTIIIASGESSEKFRYNETTVGLHWINASAPAESDLENATQQLTILPTEPVFSAVGVTDLEPDAGTNVTLRVQVADEFGNPFKDFGISWDLKDGPGSLEHESGETNEDGIAEVEFETTDAIGAVSNVTAIVLDDDGEEMFDPVKFTITTQPPRITGADTEASSLLTSASGVKYTFSFTTSYDWPDNGTFEVLFPSGYALTSPSASISGCDGGIEDTTLSDRMVTVTRDGDGSTCDAGTEAEVEIRGVVNRDATGSTGSFLANLFDADDNPLMRASFPGVSLVDPEDDDEDEEEDRPSPVVDLSVVSSQTTMDSVTLQWTAPDAQGQIVSDYRVAVSTSPITEGNFAGKVTDDVDLDPDALVAPGEIQQTTVSGLDAETEYYFAVRAVDAQGNLSDLSNVVTATTQTPFDPVSANLALQSTVRVRPAEDGMEVSWDGEAVPEQAMGIILWRINSPATFAGIVNADDPEFDNASVVDPNGNPRSGYLLTLFYGTDEGQGYNTESLAEIAGFLGTTEDEIMEQWGVARAADEESGFPYWWFAIAFLAALAVVAVIMVLWIRRDKRATRDAVLAKYDEEPREDSDAFAWADPEKDPEEDPLAWPAEEPSEAEPDPWALPGEDDTADESEPSGATAGTTPPSDEDWSFDLDPDSEPAESPEAPPAEPDDGIDSWGDDPVWEPDHVGDGPEESESSSQAPPPEGERETREH